MRPYVPPGGSFVCLFVCLFVCPMPLRSRDIGSAMHASAAARQCAHSAFRAAASVPSSRHKPAALNERVHNVLVGLAVAIASYRRGGREDRAARRAVGAAATAVERGARAVVAERWRVARVSFRARKRALARPKRAKRPTLEAEHKRACQLPRGRVAVGRLWQSFIMYGYGWVRKAP